LIKLKDILNEEIENSITSIDVGESIEDSTDKKTVSVLGVLGCKSAEDPNGTYTINNIRYNKEKVLDAIGNSLKILIFNKDKKIIHTELHSKSKLLKVNFKFPKTEMKDGEYFVVVSKDNKTLTYQPVTYESFFGSTDDFFGSKDDFFKK